MNTIKHIFVIPNSNDLIECGFFDRLAGRLIRSKEYVGFEIIVSFFYIDINFNPIYGLKNGKIKLLTGIPGKLEDWNYSERNWDNNSIVINRNSNFSLFSDLKIGDQFDFAGYLLTKTTNTEATREIALSDFVEQIKHNFKGDEKVFPA